MRKDSLRLVDDAIEALCYVSNRPQLDILTAIARLRTARGKIQVVLRDIKERLQSKGGQR